MLRPKKIFYIGLSRTGTTSLHNILSDLGFKSIHFCNFLFGESPDFNKCNEFDALGDSPVPFLFKQLDLQYPDSKFILTIRDKHNWLKSMKWMFKHGKVIWNWGEIIHDYNEKFYGTRFYNKQILAKHWDEYHDNVFKYFSTSPERLLVIKLENGFNVNDICEFLEVPSQEIIHYRKNIQRSSSFIKRIKYNLKYHLKRLI